MNKQVLYPSNLGFKSDFSTLSLGRVIQIRDKILDLTKPKIMGVINLTPDSFSDGGQYNTVELALGRVTQMLDEGVDIIDIGAESTRPNSENVSLDEELDRLISITQNINLKVNDYNKKHNTNILISIDTSKPEVMKAVIDKCQVDIINDVRALRERNDNIDSLDVLREANIPVILMHMQGKPRSMQKQPKYEHVVNDVYNFFLHRIDICIKFGIKRKNILLDPGFGFGKTWYDNASLLKYLSKFQELHCPLVVGVSRKSMIEQNRPGSVEVSDRLPGSLALASMAIERGASIIRCHDVKETRQAIDLVFGILEDGNCLDE